MAQIHQIASRRSGEVNQIRAQARRQMGMSPGPKRDQSNHISNRVDPKDDIDAAWAAFEKSRG